MYSLVEKRPFLSAITLFTANTILICGIFIYNVSTLSSLSDTDIYKAFENPTFIYFGLILNVSTAIPTAIDLILDFSFYQDEQFENENENHSNGSLIERAFLAALNVVTGSIVLLLRNETNLPYIYACTHAMQFVGSMGMVLLICRKLVPKFFTPGEIFSVQLFFSLASMTSMLGFGHTIVYWPNIVTFLFIMIFFYILIGRICISWLLDLRRRIVKGSDVLTTNELCALWYFMSTCIVLIFVPGVVATLKLYDWSRFEIWDIYVFVYSFAIYGIIVSTIPGRIARFAIEKERKQLVERKRSLIRYMSHEVRSPLNVICSGLRFLWNDISNMSPAVDNSNLLEMLSSIRQASKDVVQTTNDLLQLDSIDSATFSISRERVLCSEMTKLADYCREVAVEKGISLTANNHFDSSSAEEEGEEREEERVANSPRELRDIEIGSRSDNLPEQAPFVHIDQEKLGQVLSSIVTHSAKCTPDGQSISLNIRLANAAELSESVHQDLPNGDATSAEVPGRNGVNSGDHLFAGFYFTLPYYKPVLVRRAEPPTQSGVANLLSLARRVVQVSPDLAENDEIDDTIVSLPRPVTSHPSSNLRDRKVLVVDDSRANVKIMIKLIKQSSFQLGEYDTKQLTHSRSSPYLQAPSDNHLEDKLKFVFHEASDGTDAVKMVQEESDKGDPFDAVFMDNIMHVMHGPAAAEAMRSAGFRGLIVGVTGNVMPKDVSEYIERGADVVVAKPVNIIELKKILERIL